MYNMYISTHGIFHLVGIFRYIYAHSECIVCDHRDVHCYGVGREHMITSSSVIGPSIMSVARYTLCVVDSMTIRLFFGFREMFDVQLVINGK